MNDDMLIALVQDNEELYDQGSKFYFDGKLKNRRWREIGVKLNKSAKECKVRWESLRAQFRRYLKSLGTTTGEAAKKRNKWKYDDEMAFLIPYMKDKARVSSVKTEHEVHLDDESLTGDDCGTSADQQVDDPWDVPSVTTATVTKKDVENNQRLPRRKIPGGSASPTLMNCIFSQRDFESTTASETKEKDSVDLFFDSIKATVRTFSPADFYAVKTRVFNIVSEIEGKYLVSGNASTTNISIWK